MLQNKIAERKNKFIPDPQLPSKTDLDKDYKNSGFDKGHLVPANDMSYSGIAMNESFYYSNVCPQEPSFNRGIWKKLEEQVRKWTNKYNELIIISGAIVSDTLPTIGIHHLSVPYYFYKIVACFSCHEKMAIGFIIPNKKSELPIQNYAVSIDSIEKLTHIDFFPSLTKSLQDQLEAQCNINLWESK